MNPALTPYIEYALTTRHYCYVPGLGAFMSREVPARLSAEADGTYRVQPPRREVTFNARMHHDDGVLTVLVSQGRKLTYPQAEVFVRHEVRAIRRRLDEAGSCPLGQVGELHQSAAGPETEVRFEPAPRDGAAETYGLAELSVTSWRTLEQERLRAARAARTHTDGTETEQPDSARRVPAIRTDRERIHFSIPRRWLHHAAVIVLIICAFFALPGTSDRDAGRSEYAAMPLTALQTLQHIDTRTWQTWEEAWEADDLLASLPDPTEAPSAPADTAIAPTDVQPTLAEAATLTTDAQPASGNNTPPEAPRAQAEKLYYIIVGSSTTLREAEATRSKMQARGLEGIDILERDGRFRLYVETFGDKAEAQRYLDALRLERPEYGDAWLLPVRLGRTAPTPQPIIKNTHNDGNQLSMELSHPKHRTASDQG